MASAFIRLDLLLSILGVAWFSVPEECVWSFAALGLGVYHSYCTDFKPFRFPLSFSILPITHVGDLDLKIKFGSISADFTNLSRLKCLHSHTVYRFYNRPWLQFVYVRCYADSVIPCHV